MRNESERSLNRRLSVYVGATAAFHYRGALTLPLPPIAKAEPASMNLSRILCSPERHDDTEVVAVPQTINERERFTFVPDHQRKRPYRMSVKQRQRRTEYEAYTSRVENLTWDINELRQQIRYLLERRDLYFTRLLLQGQYYQSQVIDLSWKFLASLRSERHGLALSEEEACPPSAGRNVQQFVAKRGRPPFTHRQFVVRSVRVLVDITTAGGYAAGSRAQQVCTAGGVCVVEVLALFTGRISRDTIVGMCPQLLSDEALTARLVGQAVTFSPRLLLYFDAQQRIVRQIVQAEVLAAITAVAT